MLAPSPNQRVYGNVDPRIVHCIVAVLLAIQFAMLANAAKVHSPTLLEPAHLAAGVSNWQFARFDLYRVNPPLVRMLAALPILAVGCETDWRGFQYYKGPGSRPEFLVGRDFVTANGPRTIWLTTLARWACIPISVLGGLFCFWWASELSGHVGCGLLALSLWCFEPNILGHGELVSTDAAATTFGVGAAYFFWRWLNQPTWTNALFAGITLGLAQLAKMSWVFLFPLWPVLWMFWRLAPRAFPSSPLPPMRHLAAILLLGLYVLNLGYAFSGAFTRLDKFVFVSRTMTGNDVAGTPGNRFAGTWLGGIPVPLPRDYLLGIDAQKRDLEDYHGESSYLRGEWKRGGWWYYYLYGLAVKTPHGHQILLALSLAGAIFSAATSRGVWRDGVVLLAPPLLLLTIASSQLEFTHYVRYVLPVIGFAVVGAGCAWPRGGPLLGLRRLIVMAALGWSVWATASHYPHYLAYFNEAAGGPLSGHTHLLHDGVDFGQDLFFAEEFCESLDDPKNAHVLYMGGYRAKDLGVKTNTPVTLPLSPGTYVVSATPLVGWKERHAQGGLDPYAQVLEALSRHPYRRIKGCAMVVVTVPFQEGDVP